MKMQGITLKLGPAEKKRLKALLTKKGRSQYGQFLAEGVRLLEESLRFNSLPVTLYYSRAEMNERGLKLVSLFERQGVKCLEIAAKDINQLSDARTSQGLIGLFNIPQYGSGEIAGGKYGRILMLDGVSDPGNAGALIRSALAFGFDLVLGSGETVDLYNPKVVRSSAGAIFGIPVSAGSLADAAVLKKHQNYAVIITDPRGGNIRTRMRKFKAGKRLILAIGSEAEGISAELRSLADYSIRIEHSAVVESLNAAVAGSILMKEIYELTARRSKP
ncbi:MAG: RNA methyltransferase [Candidatus Zixiibacteriota bacterium]